MNCTRFRLSDCFSSVTVWNNIASLLDVTYYKINKRLWQTRDCLNFGCRGRLRLCFRHHLCSHRWHVVIDSDEKTNFLTNNREANLVLCIINACYNLPFPCLQVLHTRSRPCNRECTTLTWELWTSRADAPTVGTRSWGISQGSIG